MHSTHGNSSSTARFGTGNATSLHTQLHCLQDISCDVLLVQETRIQERAQAAMRELLRKEGWSVLWGHHAPSPHWGGVAILTKNGHSATHVAPTTASGAKAYAAGRLQVAAVALGDGRRVVYVINLYAHSGCGRTQDASR